MAKLELEPHWTLKVTTRELNLIRGALGGRLKVEDESDAKLLDTNLSQQVVANTKNQMERVNKLARNIGE